jgi:hypothetical protein
LGELTHGQTLADEWVWKAYHRHQAEKTRTFSHTLAANFLRPIRSAVEEGMKHGRKIGKRAVTHFLKPVN